jgi:hypothetical protein
VPCGGSDIMTAFFEFHSATSIVQNFGEIQLSLYRSFCNRGLVLSLNMDFNWQDAHMNFWATQ